MNHIESCKYEIPRSINASMHSTIDWHCICDWENFENYTMMFSVEVMTWSVYTFYCAFQYLIHDIINVNKND